MRFSFPLRFLVLFLCIRCLLDGPRPKGGRFTREFSRVLAPGLRKPSLFSVLNGLCRGPREVAASGCQPGGQAGRYRTTGRQAQAHTGRHRQANWQASRQASRQASSSSSSSSSSNSGRLDATNNGMASKLDSKKPLFSNTFPCLGSHGVIVLETKLAKQ